MVAEALRSRKRSPDRREIMECVPLLQNRYVEARLADDRI